MLKSDSTLLRRDWPVEDVDEELEAMMNRHRTLFH